MKKVVRATGSENPFRNQPSLIYQAFRLATEGTTLDAIRLLAESKGGDAGRLLASLRSGNHRGWTWRLDERNGSLHVLDLKHN